MTQWMEIISWGATLLGLGGGTLLFYNSKRRIEQAKSRENEVKADIAEADAYCKRIRNLSEEITQLSEEIRKVRGQLTEALGELQKTKEELTTANSLIHTLKINKEEMQELLTNTEKENRELKRSNSILRKKLHKLMNQNDKNEEV